VCVGGVGIRTRIWEWSVAALVGGVSLVLCAKKGFRFGFSEKSEQLFACTL